MGGPSHATDEGPDFPAQETQGSVSSIYLAAGRSGNMLDQSDLARMGKLLSDRKLRPVFWIYQRLGGEEEPETFDACEATPWLRLEQVE